MPIKLPEKCLRFTDSECYPLSQIESDDKVSFICCGLNGKKDGDIFRVCWKNKEIDEMSDWDERDIIDTISVLSQALSIKMNFKREGV